MATRLFYVFLYVGTSSSARRARAHSIPVDQARGKLEDLCEAIVRSKGTLCARAAARTIGLRADTLPIWLKEFTNMNYRQFRSYVKIRTAAHLLVRTAHPISRILLACGFLDRASFDRMFLKRMRVSPAAYRQKSDSGHKSP